MIKLKAALAGIGVFGASTDASGGTSSSTTNDFTENEQHLFRIIRSLQDELLCKQRELVECYQVIEECKLQLEGVRSLIILATADHLDMEALKDAHDTFSTQHCCGSSLAPHGARHGDAPVRDGGGEHVVEREPAD
jgi:hypothetical protein